MDTGIYAGVSHDDSTVHQKDKVLPEKDEADAVFLCKKKRKSLRCSFGKNNIDGEKSEKNKYPYHFRNV